MFLMVTTHDTDSGLESTKTLSHSAWSENEIRYDGWKSLISSKVSVQTKTKDCTTSSTSGGFQLPSFLSLFLSMKYDDDSIGSGRRDDFSKGNAWKDDANKSRCKMDRGDVIAVDVTHRRVSKHRGGVRSSYYDALKGTELMDKRDRPFKGGSIAVVSLVYRRSILFPSKTEVSNARSGNRTELYIAMYM
ncbi:uncharacterized protein LOC115239129 [Formica exsecta]|uniref:uncharacterized protein LOC115239129 n=1 Tax=Formica exsecta TaxID=72781 RepID=UPI001143D84E|nr:uncharacterized protein LOC115239129 [Formica exsecta]